MGNQSVRNALNSEFEAMTRMANSLGNIVEQLDGFNGNTGTLKVACPSAGRTMARISAGVIPMENAEDELLVSIAEDLGHDVEFGLDNERVVKVGSRSVKQELNLAKSISWNDLSNIIEVGKEYVEVKSKVLEAYLT